MIELNFKRSVKQIYSLAAYDGFDFVVEAGSALGLWLGLSGVGVFDLFVDIFNQCKSILK